jgi:serine/threonine-protein kinase
VRSELTIVLPALVVLAVTALVARSVWGWRLPAPPEARPHRIDTDVGARAERRALACEASRARLHAGASTAAFDTEGWVVELWLARAGTTELLHHPAVAELEVEGRLADSADSYLVPMPDGALDVTSGLSPEEAARSPGWRAVTIRFRGGYVAALQDTAGRASFIALAERLSQASSADLGALYARCAHLGTRDVGVWFRGGDAPSAAAALIHAIGLHADFPVIDRSALVGRDDEMETLRAVADRLDLATLARIVVDHGATLKKAPSGAVSLTFAVDEATRALPASRAVGEAMQTMKAASARARR